MLRERKTAGNTPNPTLGENKRTENLERVLSLEERHKWVTGDACYMAEHRSPPYPDYLDDWLQTEEEIDAIIQSKLSIQPGRD
jgi:hypothetical protein